VMHPVRGGLLTEEEFEFVYNLDADLGPLALPEGKSLAQNTPAQEEPAQENRSPLNQNSPASPVASQPAELVTRLSPTQESAPPEEFATTPQQAGSEDFIPSIKVG
jgi:hypothetical protein